MDQEVELLWDGLNALAEREPLPVAAILGDDSPGQLPELAEATPFLRRVAAVHRAAEDGGVHVDRACARALEAASMRGHRRGVLPEHDVAVQLLGTAIDARLLDLEPATRRLHPGPEATLIADHPLAAWGECLPLVVHGDPLTPEAQVGETAALLPLLYQYVVRDAESPLEPCVRAVWREGVERAGRRGTRPPSPRLVRRQIAALTAMLEEFGVLTWHPKDGRLGTVRPTWLGLFGWLVITVELHGPTPEVDRLATENGYLRADGGYIHRDSLPVEIADN